MVRLPKKKRSEPQKKGVTVLGVPPPNLPHDITDPCGWGRISARHEPSRTLNCWPWLLTQLPSPEDADSAYARLSMDFLRLLFQSLNSTNVSGVSLDVKYLYYSLRQEKHMEVVSEDIDKYGSFRSQHDYGVSVNSFFELMGSSLPSSIVEFEGAHCQQKHGVWIGSCLAPALSDIFTACFDRRLEHELGDLGVERVFRFVSDYLVLFK
ncbi:hypothetical protein HPB48_019919 [Haemaphysalis longicornis]|uniref:Reverse transcriptase domain-containing protein n=1 Tax=Haemaphysalis longicornis TaxID=44386 RepID=A0A9J6FT67_HAELO|nr:hypothetical protein HPB48_019919 [Haemaphysalis longicornis]